MESLNSKKLLNQFLDWKITFKSQCGNDLLTNLYKRFLKFRENGTTTNNFLLGTVGTIWLGTYNLPQNYINRLAVPFENTSQEFYFYMKIFHTGTNFEKTRTRASGLNLSCRYQK